MTTVLVSAAALIFYFLLACVLLRLMRQKHSLTVLLAAAVLVFCTILSAFGNRVSFWHFVCYFGLEVMGVIFLYGLALKSLSLRMLTALATSPKPSLTRRELIDLVVRPSFLDRIGVLAERRMIESTANGYVATKKGVASVPKTSALAEHIEIKLIWTLRCLNFGRQS